MLAVSDLHAFYGKSHILHGVTLTVGEGEIVSLLGRNGVGRSTTIRAIMGDVHAAGSVRFRDEEICGRPPYVIARKGLGYVPENRDIFPTLTVRQNLLLEQKLTIALTISRRVYVMGHGHVVFEGTPENLKANDGVRKEWLEV